MFSMPQTAARTMVTTICLLSWPQLVLLASHVLDNRLRVVHPMCDPAIATREDAVASLEASTTGGLEVSKMFHSVVLVEPLFVEQDDLGVYSLQCPRSGNTSRGYASTGS